MKKPLILIGNGCRNNPELVSHLCSLGIPVMTTWQSIDLVPEDAPAFCGRPGVFGQRAANIIQNKATQIYCFGARLDGEQTAHDYSRFAPKAEKYVYDVDPAELNKLPPDWGKICGDLSQVMIDIPGEVDPRWLEWCKQLYAHFRPELEADAPSQFVGTKEFMTALSEATDENDLLAIGSSSGAVNTFLQSYRVKRGQRVTVCASIGAMGADIPMAIGGALATSRRVICVTGDGGFQLNSNELEVVRRLNLNIKFFVFSNNGYQSIRAMQDVRFNGRHVGCDPASGFTIAPIANLARCYGIEYFPMTLSGELEAMQYLLSAKGPRIYEVVVDPDWRQFPKVGSSLHGVEYSVDPMEDMTPHLDPQELRAIMEWGN